MALFSLVQGTYNLRKIHQIKKLTQFSKFLQKLKIRIDDGDDAGDDDDR